MPQISVIVPVYNVEKYIHRCVDSILNQTFTDFELILVDDGSPDNCGAICDEYAAKDSRIHVIHQENGGLSAARNAGIDWSFANSDSQWITFIDSDDYVLPQYLVKLINAAKTSDAEIIECGMRRVKTENDFSLTLNFEGIKVFTGAQACTFLYVRMDRQVSYVSACAKLIDKKLLNGIRFPMGKLHEDQFLTYQLLYKSNKVAELGDCLYLYYVANTDSIMRAQFHKKRYDDIEALNHAISFYRHNSESELVHLAGAHKRYMLAIFSLLARKVGIYRELPRSYRVSAREAYKLIRKRDGQDIAEYQLFQIYPGAIKVQAYIRKIISLLKGR